MSGRLVFSAIGGKIGARPCFTVGLPAALEMKPQLLSACLILKKIQIILTLNCIHNTEFLRIPEIVFDLNRSNLLIMKKIIAGYLAQEAAQRIREMIRKGKLKKGDRILEEPMCQAMGVSRTPLREALRILSSEGLIQLVPNKGAYVAQPSIDEIGEMFHVMSILEGECARACAGKMGPEGMKRLDDLYWKLEEHCRAEDREKYMAVNHSFHSLVQELAGNKVLSEVINGLRRKILLYRYRQIYHPDRLPESMQEHRDLQNAFRERNPAAAERCMKEHLNRQFQVLKDMDAGPSDPSAPGMPPKTRRGKKGRTQRT